MIPGMEEARVIHPGYAIEYDFVDPARVRTGPASARIPGSFMQVRSTVRRAMKRQRVRG